MTFLSYKLPDGAPQRMVWFAECDVCRSKHLGPFPNAPKVDQREIAETAGWRYQNEHPMDTCAGCLGKEPQAPTPEPVEPERPKCTDFHWVGQAFSSCDMCGKPFWDHVTHRGEPISDDLRAGVKRKWEVVEPVPESTADTKGTP